MKKIFLVLAISIFASSSFANAGTCVGQYPNTQVAVQVIVSEVQLPNNFLATVQLSSPNARYRPIYKKVRWVQNWNAPGYIGDGISLVFPSIQDPLPMGQQHGVLWLREVMSKQEAHVICM